MKYEKVILRLRNLYPAYYSVMNMSHLITTVNLTGKVCHFESEEFKSGPAFLFWEFKG